jgi:hypothetical protein
MSGKKGMKHFGESIINEVKQMIFEGKTYKEIADFFGWKDKLVVHDLMKRERRKERHASEGMISNAKGRARKDGMITDNDKNAEIKRLKMEVELLRSFLQITGRR